MEDEKEGAGRFSMIGVWNSGNGLAPCSVPYLKQFALLKIVKTEHSARRVYN